MLITTQVLQKLHPDISIERFRALSPEYLLYCLLNLYFPPWLVKILKLAIQKIESRHFYSCPRQISPPPYYHLTGRVKLLNLPGGGFSEVYPSAERSGCGLSNFNCVLLIINCHRVLKFCYHGPGIYVNQCNLQFWRKGFSRIPKQD